MTRRVSGDDLEMGDDYVWRLDGKPFTGVAEDRFPDGGLHGETEYTNGIQDGLSRTFWPDGQLRLEYWLNYGSRVRARSWHPNGQMAEDTLVGGSFMRKRVRWAEDGTVLEATHGEGG